MVSLPIILLLSWEFYRPYLEMDLWTLESYKLLKYITATIPMSNSKMHRNQQKLIKK